MTHPITPVKLGGWEHLCERGNKKREKRRQKESVRKRRGAGGGGREAEGSRIRRKVRHKLI